MATLTAIEKITRKVSRIKNGNDKIEPGQPVRISEAAAHLDAVRQGDLYLIVVEGGVSDAAAAIDFHGIYDQIDTRNIDRQLVPGNTQGAKHCLDSLDGVTMYRPRGWNAEWEELAGPFLIVSKERTVEHPTHGSVTIPAGMSVVCFYQREWDAEQRRERRNAD